MSRIYNLKTVSSQTSASVTEGKPEAQLLSFKLRREHHVHDSEAQQVQSQLHSQMFRQQLENQNLEMKLNQLYSQKTIKEKVARPPVQKQLRQIQLKEQEWNRTPQLKQCPHKLQDHEPHNQLAQPKNEQICKTQDCLHPLQHGYDNQRTPSKMHQLNQSNYCASFTINHKSTENPPKNPGRSLTAPAPSAPPSISPSQSPSLPIFSLRISASGQSKKGKTITINPRKSSTGAASLPSSGVKGLYLPAPSPNPPVGEETGKKRYPTVEEIEVIGAYQILEKSCLAKGSRPQKTVKVSFDEVQLERVFEYPSESSLLPSFLSPPLPGPKTKERKEEEECDDSEKERGAFLFEEQQCHG